MVLIVILDDNRKIIDGVDGHNQIVFMSVIIIFRVIMHIYKRKKITEVIISIIIAHKNITDTSYSLFTIYRALSLIYTKDPFNNLIE